jgi:RimJ/RimL family protein N-acetyltransferase
MVLTYPLFHRDEAEALSGFLASEEWPYHVIKHPTRQAVLARIDEGEFDSEGSRTHWICQDETMIGVVSVHDLDDDTPLFDLRLSAAHRGRGVGTAVVTWLVATLFNDFVDLGRIEATTRQDNSAMRRVLVKCGFVKEAHYRRAWPVESGDPRDSIGYGLLREDWQTGDRTMVDWNDGP